MVARFISRDIKLIRHSVVQRQLRRHLEVVRNEARLLRRAEEARMVARPARFLAYQAEQEVREGIAGIRKSLDAGPFRVLEDELSACVGRVVDDVELYAAELSPK